MLRPEDIIEERKRREEYTHQYERNSIYGQSIGANFATNIRERLMRGEIIDETLRHWLDTEITNARILLIIGILLTVLIKGQIFIWAIMYIAYRGRIRQVKEKAWEKNMQDYGGYLQ